MRDACMSAHSMLSLVLRQAAFEAIFASFDKGNKGGLTLQEMYQFTQATRLVRRCPAWTQVGLGLGSTRTTRAA